MTGIFEKWKRKRAIKVFLTKLPSDLAKGYGVQEFYTEGQVEFIVSTNNYPKKYVGYALVSFLSEDDAVKKIGNMDLVNLLRKEVAEYFFDGNENYTLILAQSRKVGNAGYCSIGAVHGGGGD